MNKATNTNYLQEQTAMLALSPVNKNYQEGMDGETWFLAEGDGDGEFTSSIFGLSARERSARLKRKQDKLKSGVGLGSIIRNTQKRKAADTKNQAALAKAANAPDTATDKLLAASLSKPKAKPAASKGKTAIKVAVGLGIAIGLIAVVVLVVKHNNKSKAKK